MSCNRRELARNRHPSDNCDRIQRRERPAPPACPARRSPRVQVWCPRLPPANALPPPRLAHRDPRRRTRAQHAQSECPLDCAAATRPIHRPRTTQHSRYTPMRPETSLVKLHEHRVSTTLRARSTLRHRTSIAPPHRPERTQQPGCSQRATLPTNPSREVITTSSPCHARPIRRRGAG
jgi:hypothetical protein